MALPLPLIGMGLNFFGKLLGGGKQTTRNEVDYVKLRQNAEAGGFNPLTALRAGGAAGFQVTHHPALSAANMLGDAMSSVGGMMVDYDWNAEQRAIDERRLIEAQIGLTTAQTGETYARTRSFDVPAGQGSSRASAPAIVNNDGAREVQPMPVGVTNPYPVGSGIRVNPKLIDASAWEERYGESEANSMIAAVLNYGGDWWYNTKPGWVGAAKAAGSIADGSGIKVRELTDEEKAEREQSWYPSWLPTFEFRRGN